MTPADIAASIMLYVHGMENGLINVQTRYLWSRNTRWCLLWEKRKTTERAARFILIARIRRQAKNVSADLQRESVTECAHCRPL